MSLSLSPTPTLQEANERLLGPVQSVGASVGGREQRGGWGGGGGLARNLKPQVEKERKSKWNFVGHLPGTRCLAGIFLSEPRNGSAL